MRSRRDRINPYYSIILLITNITFALSLTDGDLIIVHPSRRYHTKLETVNYTNEIAKKHKSKVIALYQFDISKDKDWYLKSFKDKVKSRSGEHSLKLSSKKELVSLSFMGGYVSACLGRSLAHTIKSFILSPNILKLRLKILSKGSFTGHLIKNNKIVPKTLYEASTSDFSIKGESLHKVLSILDNQERIKYLKDFVNISIIRTSALYELDDYSISVRYGKSRLQVNKGKRVKKIIIQIID